MNWRKTINFFLFLLLWPAAVLGALNNQMIPMWLILTAMLSSVVTLNKTVWVDVLLVASALVYGVFFESMGEQFGWLAYSDAQQIHGLPPSWILVLWAGMGMTFRYSNAWLFIQNYKWLCAWLMCVPLTYFSAAKLGAIQIENFLYTYVSVLLGWSVYFFLLRYVVNHPNITHHYQQGVNHA